MVTDLLFGLITVEPERSFFNGRLSFRGTISYGLIHAGYMDTLINMDDPIFTPTRVQPKTLGHYSNGKIFSAGGSVYCYSDPVKMIRYFGGIGISYGEFSYRTTVYTFNPNKPIAFLDDDCFYYSYFFRGGVWIPLNAKFHIAITSGTGFNQIYTPEYSSGYNNPPSHWKDTYRAFELGAAVGVQF